MYKILVVDDDRRRVDKIKRNICSTINIDEGSIFVADSIAAAKRLLSNSYYNILILDIVLPNRIDEPVLSDGGIKLLEYIDTNKKSIKPGRILGITSFEDKKNMFLSEFANRCFTLVFAKFNSNDWLHNLTSAISYSYDSYLDGKSINKDSIVIALHGIRTYGDWIDRLESIIDSNTKNIGFLSYKYGIFSLFSFVFPPFRLIQVLLFCKHINSCKSDLSDKDIYFVAHSFGTYILSYSLKYFPKTFNNIIIKRVVFSGSVMKSNFNWPNLFEKYTFDLVNDCGDKDYVLCLSQTLVSGVGMAGRSGFIGINNGRMINRYFNGGHSLYFETKGLKSDAFMKTYWLGCFTDDDLPKVIDQRVSKLHTPFVEFF